MIIYVPHTVNVLGRACLVRLPKSIVSLAEHRAKQHKSKDIPCSLKSRNFFKRNSSEDQYLSTVTLYAQTHTPTASYKDIFRSSQCYPHK